MSDFFGALELELQAAANRRPRRQVTVGQGLGALAVAALMAVAVGVVLAVSSGGGGGSAQVTSGGPKVDPVGTVIRKGAGEPPRTKRSIVVATGATRYAGPWQLEVQSSELLKWKGEVLQPEGLTCVFLYFPDPPGIHGRVGGGGYCGDQPRTPGFTRGEAAVPGTGNDRAITKQELIFGRTPERAKYVRITVPGGLQMRSPVQDGPKNLRSNYYVVAVPPLGRGARITWLDENNKPGSRGTRLMSPASGELHRSR